MVAKQEIILVNSVPTHVYKLGDSSKTKESVIFIPGNPGLSGFYIPFADELYKNFDGKVSIFVIAHAGHSPGADSYFTLQEQIQHKLEAINQLVTTDPKHRLILVGHSIGAYIVMKIVSHLEHRLERAFLLFPTIERMKSSPAGQNFVLLYPILIWLLPIICLFIQIIIPFESWKKQALHWYLSSSTLEHRQVLVDTIIHDLLNPKTIRNILQMANNEMQVVVKRDDELIKRFLPKLTFYYGTNDQWVPKELIQDMINMYPDGDITECSSKYMHAFVWEHSKGLADFVYSYYRTNNQ